ncbi:hypothetical protein POM88_037709 [Heracleum sosnowskyi]|uniref:NGN domain-containing protein n=1 Tax=Heracleum sosnowskyi TaxID=360622 RepID=A0AAD8HQL1_9APIA|nr:hypothetical protein POM88_037709 [Heracleum sosnowskyi]
MAVLHLNSLPTGRGPGTKGVKRLPKDYDPGLVQVESRRVCLDAGSVTALTIALDHLKNYIYIEADKEAHVKEACKGMRYIFTGTKIPLVPIKEMTDGDLAKEPVVDVDNLQKRVTVKLIPRIHLQALANKL